MQQVSITCVECQQEYIFELTDKQVNEIQTGEKFIQDILPDFSPGDREMFISQICPTCWDKIFSEEE